MKKNYYIFQMDSLTLNILSVILLLLLVGLYFLIYGSNSFIIFDINYPILILFLIPYLILHEILHSLSYVIHGAKFKNITYGMHLEKGILCCLCKQNINKKNILFSLLSPFFIIGVFTLIIGLVVNLPILVILSMVNISGCSGDLLMFYHLVKLKNYEFSEFDDPTSFGLYTNDDLSKLKLFGLNYVGKKKKLERNDYRKIVVSKTSIILLFAFYLLMIFNLLID